jgi:hypothetical protein
MSAQDKDADTASLESTVFSAELWEHLDDKSACEFELRRLQRNGGLTRGLAKVYNSRGMSLREVAEVVKFGNDLWETFENTSPNYFEKSTA